MKKVALVAGATGIAGSSLVQELDGNDDWHVIGLSRRSIAESENVSSISADLTDLNSLNNVAGELVKVTHIFYNAYMQLGTRAAEIAPNLEMLQNLVNTVEKVSPDLRHVQLTHGSKWYGSHLGPYLTPAKEDQPRPPMPVFYHSQQDWLASRQQGKAWTWSALRPHGIWGFAIGSQLNMMNAIAVYATLLKHMELPLVFPGKQGAYTALYQCTDAGYYARSMVWAATHESAANEAFNITNGDYIRWSHAWPLIAEWFGMPVGEPLSFDVGAFASDKEDMWGEICRKYDLKKYSISDLTTWEAAISFIFNADWDQMSAMTKAQQAGWGEVVDTYEMIPRMLDTLASERVIPPRN